jgi:hypothetical protein
MPRAGEVRALAEQFLVVMGAGQPGEIRAHAEQELERLLADHADTIEDLPRESVVGLVRTFAGGFDPAAYADQLGAMTNEELRAEIERTAQTMADIRARVQKRDALMRDLRDTTLRLAVRSLLAALVAA